MFAKEISWGTRALNFIAAYLKVPKIMLICTHNVLRPMLSAQTTSAVGKRSSPRMRCQNKENSLIFSPLLPPHNADLAEFWSSPAPISQTGGSSAAVYFVNGLFQLSSAVARVHDQRTREQDLSPHRFLLIF